MIETRSITQPIYITFILFSAILIILLPHSSLANDQHKTGLKPFTQEELIYQNKYHKKVKKIKLNSIGANRINDFRIKHGQRPIEYTNLVDIGSEITSAIDGTSNDETVNIPESLPNYVDNSTLKFFPPIRSQGNLGSCGVFSGTYYTLTYMNALANNLDAKNGGDQYRFSPKWSYNMTNSGYNIGTWYYWAYDLGIKNGLMTWSEFPYDSNYRQWPLNANYWFNALYRRVKDYGYVDKTDTDDGINQLKQMLLNGYILNIPTYIESWQWVTISNDPETTEDDSFVGKPAVYWVKDEHGYHAMTLVGYNDDIWIDINRNGIVDSGEKGAFRIANSWGTKWNENGFAWMAYDALKSNSAVSGGPSLGRGAGFYPARAHYVNMLINYQPKFVAKFTINHALRNQLYLSLGISNTTSTSPSSTIITNAIYGDGGPYAFDGTTNSVSGTFYLDYSSIAPSTSNNYRLYIISKDSSSDGNPALLQSFSIIDLDNSLEHTSTNMPTSIDGETINSFIDISI